MSVMYARHSHTSLYGLIQTHAHTISSMQPSMKYIDPDIEVYVLCFVHRVLWWWVAWHGISIAHYTRIYIHTQHKISKHEEPFRMKTKLYVFAFSFFGRCLYLGVGLLQYKALRIHNFHVNIIYVFVCITRVSFYIFM